MSSRLPPEQGHAGGRRRQVIQGLLLGALAAALARPASVRAAAAADMRRISLVNTHTGEMLETSYFEDGSYLQAQLGRLDWLLRDHRSGECVPIDRRIFDLLHELATSAGREPRYQVISAYRSSATNAMLAATTGGVSSRSLHMQGQAIDVRLEGLPTAMLRELALARQAGGVGYYPASDFLHLDLGRIRQWTG